MALRNKKKTSFLKNRLFQLLFNPQALPFTLTFSILIVLFVAVRMKGIEQAYHLNALAEETEKAIIVNKELKAHRARMLSVQQLRDYAEKFNLKEPGPEQIILIP